MAYDNNMTGIISKNDRKTEDKHPDIKGQCTIDGVEYWVSGWHKTKKDGIGKFYSLSFNRKDQQQAPQQSRSQPAPPASSDPMDPSDIPFSPIGRGISGHAM